MPGHPFSLRFRETVRRESGPEAIELRSVDAKLTCRNTTECKLLIDLLFARGVESSQNVLASAPFTSWTQLMVPQFEALAMVQYEVLDDSREAMVLEPLTRLWRVNWRPVTQSDRIKASRFAHLRVENGICFLETPLEPARILFRDPRHCALWGSLAEARTPSECAGWAQAGIGEEQVCRCLELLVCSGAAGVTDAEGRLAEESDPALMVWSHHELLFHARSRIGRHDLPIGATFRFRGRIREPAAKKEPVSSDPLLLPKPDATYLKSCDMTLLSAIDVRHSSRTWDESNPITLSQLATFLFLSCRTKRIDGPAPDDSPGSYTRVVRPCPAGGSMGELEVYVLTERCAGLPAGAWHYDSHEHALQPLPSGAAIRAKLLGGAQAAMGAERLPQVLLIVTARHQRLLWKYSSIAYSLSLKHVGVLFECWYLLAAGLGLGACALGMGDADLFARLSGNPYSEESSIGEFALGSVPDDSFVSRTA